MVAPRGDVAIAVLAAGRGSRLGGDDAKPLLEWHGRPLLAWALAAATGTGFDPIIVVTGYKRHEVGKVVAERFDGFKGITVVHNRHWKQGIASSLHAVLAFVDPFTRSARCASASPTSRSSAARRTAGSPPRTTTAPTLAVATYDGQRANPVLLARSLWAEARELTGDDGARALMQRHDVVEVPCDDTGSPTTSTPPPISSG